ncbi:hypothetical protein [Lysinibacillus fusiformis]|nr:hypothetical protein [Lysinibacillus fusiformis]
MQNNTGAGKTTAVMKMLSNENIQKLIKNEKKKPICKIKFNKRNEE